MATKEAVGRARTAARLNFGLSGPSVDRDNIYLGVDVAVSQDWDVNPRTTAYREAFRPRPDIIPPHWGSVWCIRIQAPTNKRPDPEAAKQLKALGWSRINNHSWVYPMRFPAP